MRQDLYPVPAPAQGESAEAGKESPPQSIFCAACSHAFWGTSFSVGCPGFPAFSERGGLGRELVSHRAHLSRYKGSERLSDLLASQWFLTVQQSEKSKC